MLDKGFWRSLPRWPLGAMPHWWRPRCLFLKWWRTSTAYADGLVHGRQIPPPRADPHVPIGMNERVTGNSIAIHLRRTKLVGCRPPLVKVIPEILVVEAKARAMRTLRPGTIADPKLKINNGIPLFGDDLLLPESTAAPAKCSVHRGALEHGVRGSEHGHVSIERPYNYARRDRHLLSI